MRSPENQSALFVTQAGEASFSNTAFLTLLEGILLKGKPCRFQAKGGSMSPFLKDGDVITVSPWSNTSPHLGDLVAALHPVTGQLIAHRLTGKRGDLFQVQGDNLPQADGLIPKRQVLGRITKVERNGRAVNLGLGLERFPIAWLARTGLLLRSKSLYSTFRRGAGKLLRHLQGFRFYRVWGRRINCHVEIKEASEQEMALVRCHFNPALPDQVASSDPNTTNYVARNRSDVIGFVQLVRNTEEDSPWFGSWLFSMEVWPLYRGFGIGEALAKRLIKQAQAEHAPELFLVVFNDNDRAIGLYNKLGFERVAPAALEQILENEKEESGRRRIVMRKMLFNR